VEHYWIAAILVLAGGILLALTNDGVPGLWNRELCWLLGFTFFVVGAVEIIGVFTIA
jgi:hypothetical protein